MSRLLIRPPKLPPWRGETMAGTMRRARRQAGPAMFWWAASVVLLIVPADAADLIAHWPLTVNAQDRVGSRPAASSLDVPDRVLDLSTAAPVRIGFGGLTYFSGALSDVRLYRGALSQQEIVALAR